MIRRYLAVAGMLVMAAAGAEAGMQSQNCVGGSDGARLSLNSWRNVSGHWLATLRVEHSAPAGRRTHRLNLDVDPSSWRCGNIRTDAVTIHIQGSPPPPGPGYAKLAGGGFYKVHPELTNWDDAKTVCEDEDAHLLIINSQAEANAILELIKRDPSLSIWIHIGFHDKDQEGHYVTLFGETLEEAGYSRWRSTDPTKHPSEDCGGIDKQVELVDIQCTGHKVAFICEHNYSE